MGEIFVFNYPLAIIYLIIKIKAVIISLLLQHPKKIHRFIFVALSSMLVLSERDEAMLVKKIVGDSRSTKVILSTLSSLSSILPSSSPPIDQIYIDNYFLRH